MVLILDADYDAAVRKHNERMSLAWHVAILSRSNKPPQLKTLLMQPRQSGREPWRKQLNGLMAWVVAHGGTIIRKSEGK